jgi:hypothetical protein
MKILSKASRYMYGITIGILLEYIVRIEPNETFAWICLAFVLLIMLIDLFSNDNKR